MELLVVEPPLQLTVAPDTAAPVEAFVILPVTVPVVELGDSVKLAVVVAPPVTVTLCVTLAKPLAEATSCAVPTGTPVSVYTPEVLVVVVPAPNPTEAPAIAVPAELLTVPVMVPLPETKVILGAVVVVAATTVTEVEADVKPVREAVTVAAPAGRLLNV